MNATYDEDLSQNPFFTEFQNEHSELLERCISDEWILCVPRVGTVLSHVFTLQDFLGHILISNDELPTTHFSTLTERTVRVKNKVISLDRDEAGIPLEIHILFEETFYTVDNMKYKVWCIEYPLEMEFTLNTHNISLCRNLNTLRDCIDFLWTESSGKDVLEGMDSIILNFKSNFKKNQYLSINKLKDFTGSLYTNCLQVAFKNRRLKERCRDCKYIMDNVKLAIETYMHHGIYKEVFEALCTCSAYEDSSLNKIIRNLSDIQLQDLGIKQEFNQCIPVAKRNLSLIQSYGTILGKVSCIKKTITAINKTSSQPDENQLFATTDELLPIIIFIVIKSGLPNWLAHLNFMKYFRFSVHSYFQSDEVSFCISTLEAVIEQIKSGLVSGCSCPESQCSVENDFINENFELIRNCRKESCSKLLSEKKFDITHSDSLEFLFEQIRLSNFDKVKEILEKNRNIYSITENIEESTDAEDSVRDFAMRKTLSLEEVLNEDNAEKPLDLCHPLCTCDKCSRVLSKNLLRTSPTTHSCDGHGFTVLHVASIYGKPQIVDLILELGAEINSTDYNGSTPLHYAASRGHQNALLLLLHAGADLNKQNMDKNTPLHLACNNGHDCCVKALVYFSEQSKNNLDVDCRNENGDTPLHLASKWGYESIVSILLGFGSDPWISNNKGKTTIDFAHSSLVTKLLLSSVPNMLEYVNIKVQPRSVKKFNRNISKTDIHLLDLNYSTDNQFPKKSDSKTVSFANENVKPISTSDIRHIERLFRAIVYGDVKLACFYMNIDENYESNKKISKLSSNDVSCDLCHPLCLCQKCVTLKAVQVQTEDVFNINTCDSQGNTALHVAVQHGRLDISKILLDNEAKFVKNNNGLTPVHIAAQENRISELQLLLKYCNNLKTKDCMGNTPLHLACIAGNTDIVKIILEIEPYEEISNFSHKTPLEEAKDGIHLTIIALLEESLCKKNPKN